MHYVIGAWYYCRSTQQAVVRYNVHVIDYVIISATPCALGHKNIVGYNRYNGVGAQTSRLILRCLLKRW